MTVLLLRHVSAGSFTIIGYFPETARQLAGTLIVYIPLYFVEVRRLIKIQTDS
jgi:hypothetical protein